MLVTTEKRKGNDAEMDRLDVAIIQVNEVYTMGLILF